MRLEPQNGSSLVHEGEDATWADGKLICRIEEANGAVGVVFKGDKADKLRDEWETRLFYGADAEPSAPGMRR